MILKTKEFKEVASTILKAIDNSETSTLKETLELKTVRSILFLNITNKEYYASVKFNLEGEENFHATVNANQFLKLVAAVTTPEIELTIHDTYILFKANGNYKIPLIFENDKLMELPLITIENPTVEMNISGEILESILNYNSKEIEKNAFKPIQRCYYLDQEGCITFSFGGACVNSFTLEKPISILLNDRLVKLFKLFKNDMVSFTLGHDIAANNVIQTKVKFETTAITLTAILVNNSSLAEVPVDKIRSLTNRVFEQSVVLDKVNFIQAIDRLMIFSDNPKDTLTSYAEFKCNEDEIIIKDGDNTEIIKTENGSKVTEEYTMLLNLTTLKNILNICPEQYITMNYGNHHSITLVRTNVKNIVTEMRLKNK